MKKLVIVLFMLCSTLFITNPIIQDVFAENNSGINTNQEVVSKDDSLEKDDSTKTTKDNEIDNDVTNNEIINIEQPTLKENTTSTNIDIPKVENKDVEVKKEEPNTTDNSKEPCDVSNVDVNENNNTNNEDVNIVKVLNKEDSLNLLLNMNPNLVYEYQGDENTFPVLKEKGLSGYVFLPNVDTDLGYFVDKNTSNIYYFHPSGYLEKIK